MQDWNATARNIQAKIDALEAEIARLRIQANYEQDEAKRKSIEILIASKETQIVQLEQQKQDAIDKARAAEEERRKMAEPSPGVTIIPYVDVPDPSAGATYEQVASAVRNNLMADLSRIQAKQQKGRIRKGGQWVVPYTPENQRRISEINKRLQNFDSWFRNVWNTEYKPVIGSRQPTIPMPITSEQMAPQAIQNQSLQQLEKAGEAIKFAPQTGTAPIKPLGQIPNFNKPISTKPPISGQNAGMAGNPLDENGIPMVQTSAGWVKDRRFYKPDGTLLGTM